MPEDALPGRFIVYRQICFFSPFAHDVHNAAKRFGLQKAVMLFHHPVAARRIKTDQGPVGTRHDRILCLVAVAAVALAADNRQDRRVHPANAGQGIGNPLLLVPQLRFVSDVPPGTAAAAAERRTIFSRPQAVAGGGQKLLHPAVGQPFFGFENPAPDPVAHRGKGNDHRHTAAVVVGFYTADAAPLGRGARNFKRYDLVFGQAHIGFLCFLFLLIVHANEKKHKKKAGKDQSLPAFFY